MNKVSVERQLSNINGAKKRGKEEKERKTNIKRENGNERGRKERKSGIKKHSSVRGGTLTSSTEKKEKKRDDFKKKVKNEYKV